MTFVSYSAGWGCIGGGAPVPPPSPAAVEKQRAELRALGLLPDRDLDEQGRGRWAAGRVRAATPDAPVGAPASLARLTAEDRESLARAFEVATGRRLTFAGRAPDQARRELEAMSPERRAALDARLARLERSEAEGQRRAAEREQRREERTRLLSLEVGVDEDGEPVQLRDVVEGLLSDDRDERADAADDLTKIEAGALVALGRFLRGYPDRNVRPAVLDAVASRFGQTSAVYQAIAGA
ncbi:MAG: hypothetical protein M9894_17170 [Planctomycetes bacterium]|nr:hypothetical protein [Planctomycetota bacterium]